MSKKNAKFLTKTFAVADFWNRFRGKNLREFKIKKLKRENTFENDQNPSKIELSLYPLLLQRLEYSRSVCGIKKGENAKLIVVDDD